MRLALTAVLVCLGLLVWASQPAASQSTASPAQPVDASLSSQLDAAEKHARRTACLKDAKSKKLVGAHKTAFLKECIAADTSPGPSAGSMPSQSAPAPE
jgi:hypothetical protein